jgi:hypothetical protein
MEPMIFSNLIFFIPLAVEEQLILQRLVFGLAHNVL